MCDADAASQFLRGVLLPENTYPYSNQHSDLSFGANQGLKLPARSHARIKTI
jgi:hypothetical protein